MKYDRDEIGMRENAAGGEYWDEGPQYPQSIGNEER